ncbi:DUF6541 family protein [Oerskovia enterophila]|uniref:DUF6541 family protein n=1 Tax=Oerskovia enterophila TaxID=43678 RepID=UPI003830761A
MTLLDVVLAGLLVLAVWWIPGVVLGRAVGLRWLDLVVAGPVLSLGFFTVLGVWSGMLGMPWDILSVSLSLVGVSALVFGARMVWGRRRRQRAPVPPKVSLPLPRGRAALYVAAGIAVGAVVGTWTWWQATQGLTLLNQDWDIPWHANMVRLIADTREWSTGLAGNFAYYDTVIEDAPIRNYPIAFHAVVALVWPLSSLGVPEFLGVFQLFVIALQVPLSAAVMTWYLSRRAGAAAIAAVAATALSSFPYDLLFRGPLIPLVIGLALLGPFLVVVLRAAQKRSLTLGVVGGIGAVGLFGAHASIGVVAAVVLLIWVVLASPWTWSGVRSRFLGLLPVGLVAVVLGGPLVLEMLRESGRVSEIQWPAYQTVPQAFGEVLLFSHGSGMAQWFWAVLVLLGSWALLRRRQLWWYLVVYIVAVGLAAFTAGSDGELITRLTAFVYNDAWRLVGVATLLAVPVVGIGGQWALDQVRARVTARPRIANGALSVVGVLLLVLVLQGDAQRNVSSMQRGYRAGETVTHGEREMMEALSAVVPADGQVLNDVCDGSAWMFALSNRMPMMRHFEVIPTLRQELLLEHFNDFDDDPEVRRAAAELGITHVYVGTGLIRQYLDQPSGLEDLDDVEALRLVAGNSDARIYEIDWASVGDGQQMLDQARENQVHRDGVPGIWESKDPDALADRNAVCV